MKKLFTTIFILFVVLASSNTSFAQWPTNTRVNVGAAVTADDHQQNFWTRNATCSDGTGGAITCWYTANSTNTSFTIGASRIDKNGTVVWTQTVCAAIGTTGRENPVIISDGSGGAVISWEDWRYNNQAELDIYAARLDVNGNFVFGGSNGVKIIATGYGNDYYPQMCTDGAGGAIITWQAMYAYAQVYARHISGTGTPSWGGIYGLAIADDTLHNHLNPVIASDNAGGAYIAWQDDTQASNANIMAKYINAAGNVVWGGTLGIAVCDTIGNQGGQVIQPDGFGNAIVAWLDPRSGGSWIFAQKVNANGTMLWTKNGVNIERTSCENPRIGPDGTGGAYITWNTGPNQQGSHTGSQDVYAQYINSGGTVKLGINGQAIANLAGTQWRGDLITTGDAGALIAWGDYRDSVTSDIYIQKIDSSGTTRWAPSTGVLVSNAYCSQGAGYVALASDACNGAILTWMDRRNSPGCALTHNDIYAQNVNSNGTIGGVSGTIGCTLAPPPHAQFSASDSSICAFDCISFTDLSTNTPTTWSWTFQGGTPATSTSSTPYVCYQDTNGGNYFVKLVVSNSGGSDSTTYTTFIHASPAPAYPTISRSGDTLQCNTNPAYVKYQWSVGSFDIPGATTPTYVFDSSGNYNIKVTNSIGCSSSAGINVVKDSVGFENYIFDNTFSLSPNPADKNIYIHSTKSGDVTLTVYDLLGEKVMEERTKLVNVLPVNIEPLRQGVYFITLRNDSGVRWIGKFIRE